MFGERLKELREEKGMSQQDLAYFLNISRSSVSAYENNTNYPDPQILVKLADLFDVSLDYLLGRTKERANYNLLNKYDRELMYQLYLVIKNSKTNRK